MLLIVMMAELCSERATVAEDERNALYSNASTRYTIDTTEMAFEVVVILRYILFHSVNTHAGIFLTDRAKHV
jgi:uncharacterized membrane protein